MVVMASEGDECYLPTHMLEVSIVEDNNATSTELQDVFLETEDDVEEAEKKPELVQATPPTKSKRSGVPVVPTSSEELEFYNKLFEDISVVRYLRIHCSVCDCHIGCCPESSDVAFRHRVLGVLVCKQCYVFYGEGNFPQGEDGSEIYCRWCGQGGRLVCCSTCPCTFCKKCISRNFTKRAKQEFEKILDWGCFVCNPHCIWEHRAICWAVTSYIQKESEDWKCGIESGRAMYGPRIPAPGDDANFCCDGPSSHRRISMGVPGEERLKMFVQAATRHKNFDENCEKNLITQLTNEARIVPNNVPRIKPRDISELTGKSQKDISNSGSNLPGTILNPISIVNPTSNVNCVYPPMPPMVQFPSNSFPPPQPLNGQQKATAPLVNPYNIVSPSVTTNSPITDIPYNRLIVKTVGNNNNNNNNNNNIVRVPVVTSSQLGHYFPNPMAVIRAPNSQATTYSSSQLLQSLTHGSHFVTAGMNPRPVTKIAIINGQMTVPNQPGCYYVNAGQKRYIGSLIQQFKSAPNSAASTQNKVRVPSSNNIQANQQTDDDDDDVRIISSTPVNQAGTRVIQAVVQSPKPVLETSSSPAIVDSPQNNLFSNEAQKEKNATSNPATASDNSGSLLQINTLPPDEALSEQLKKSLDKVDDISRNMNSHALLMREMYKKLSKQNDLLGLENLTKKMQRMLKKAVQKICAVDSTVLNDFENYILTRSSNKIADNPSEICTVSLDSSDQKGDDILSVEDEVQIDWDSSDSSDSEVKFTRDISEHVQSNQKKTNSSRSEDVAQSNSSQSSKSSKSLIKHEPEFPSKTKNLACNVIKEQEKDYNKDNPVKLSLSKEEMKRSLNCAVPIKRKVVGAQYETPVKKRKHSNSSDKSYSEVDTCQIPAEWAKIIRPCSVVLVKGKHLLGKQILNLAI